MKDQIDVAVRRSPKYSVFMGIGTIIGVLVAGLLTIFVDPAQIPNGYTVGKGAGLLLIILGVIGLFLGGLVALILDWVGRRKAKKYRVDAQIDVVDDPKEIARRRIAEMNGEDPDAVPDATDTTASAGDAGDDHRANGTSGSEV